MEKIYAGIVTFNPDIERLKENVCAICIQVPEVVIFDNGSSNFADIQECISVFHNAILIHSDENIGIAAALNRLMQWGSNNNYDWMLSLDQDSVCDASYVNKMKQYLDVEPLLGIVAPVIVDRNVGAFSKIEYWKQIGEYDESMFIDSVDFEYCYRMRKNGYGVIQVKDVHLLHELGNSVKCRFLFWKIDVTGHSAFRKYYIARNNVYYPKKHHLWIRFIRGNYRNLKMIAIVLLYEDNKKEKIRSILSGWKNAY